MNEEIEQIEKKKSWTLVPRPKDKNVISTKQVFRNKLNEDGKVSRKKERLVCKGYSQEEGIDYDEKFLLLQDQKVLELYQHMELTEVLKSIKWM